MSSQETYKRFAQYYDVYVGDFNADLPLYRSLCVPDHNVLEIGCGTGRVLYTLLEEGVIALLPRLTPRLADEIHWVSNSPTALAWVSWPDSADAPHSIRH